MHATANCPKHVDPFPSACLSCLSYNLCCADKGPRQGFDAQAHSYTPTGKGRALRGAFSSTAHTGTGTGSAGGSGKQSKGDYQAIGVVAAVAGSIAYGVHHFDQNMAATEIARIEAQAKAEVARIEGERKLAEQHWKAEVERYKHDLQLAYTQDYGPYQAAILEKRKKRGGTGGLEKGEKTH